MVIAGVGLIGGSIGLALKNKKLVREVVGVARHQATLGRAIRLKAIDRGALDIKDAVAGADMVVLAVPVGTIVPLVKEMIPRLKKGCIITDAGSTKEAIIKQIEKILPPEINFVGGHPLAGSEKSGVLFADSRLFKNSICVLTPTVTTDPRALNQVRQLWAAMGARVVTVSAVEHDRIVASISHLPHILSVVLVNATLPKHIGFAAGGFADMTRLAGAESKMWIDICLTNSRNISRSVEKFIAELEKINLIIKHKQSRRLSTALVHARKVRNALLAEKNHCY